MAKRHRGTGGYWEGSYFTGVEASLRTPCLVRWPKKIPAGVESNEIVHVTDWFATLLEMAGLEAPDDREIDGVDQSAFFYGEQEESNGVASPQPLTNVSLLQTAKEQQKDS